MVGRFEKLVPIRRVVHWLDQMRFGSIDLSAPIGQRGEQAAAIYLRRKGLRIIAVNESDHAGEIDLIAIDRKTRSIIFIEVKTLRRQPPASVVGDPSSTGSNQDHPADRVDGHKQRRITQAALRFLKRRGLLGHACRFDVVAVWWPDDSAGPAHVQHIENAFEATGDFQMWS